MNDIRSVVPLAGKCFITLLRLWIDHHRSQLLNTRIRNRQCQRWQCPDSPRRVDAAARCNGSSTRFTFVEAFARFFFFYCHFVSVPLSRRELFSWQSHLNSSSLTSDKPQEQASAQELMRAILKHIWVLFFLSVSLPIRSRSFLSSKKVSRTACFPARGRSSGLRTGASRSRRGR